MPTAIAIRVAREDDADAVWRILEPVFRAGDTYPLPRDIARADALSYWFAPGNAVFVSEAEGIVVGNYYLRANQQGGGAHVANCGYAVDASARGSGIARTMCEHSMQIARETGFRAMQFNFVVSSNAAAVHLWTALGFATVGRIPAAFEHPALGAVDVLVMYRLL